jgi:cytochrome c-type biogenesis protein CcmH
MFWLVLAGMTGLAALAALWPLSLRRPARASNEGESAFYRAQLREIERDVERGQLPAEEAASARIEAARRLIAVNSAPTADALAGSVWRRRVASAAILVLVPAISLGVYLSLGEPDTPDAPLALRKAQPNTEEAIQFAIAKIEARLAANPDEVRGWEVLAPVYMKLDRYDDAVRAYQQVLRLKGDKDPNLLAAYGESLLAVANGVVTAEAHAAFDAALKIDPETPMAKFYTALASEQDGDFAKARAVYEELEPKAKGDLPWMLGLRAHLDALRNGKPLAPPVPPPPSPSAAAEASAPASFTPEQLIMIRGMVSGLAQRLADKGGTGEEWARLVRAYSVLQEPEKAKTALADARKALANDATALGSLDALAHELGLGS